MKTGLYRRLHEKYNIRMKVFHDISGFPRLGYFVNGVNFIYPLMGTRYAWNRAMVYRQYRIREEIRKIRKYWWIVRFFVSLKKLAG